MKKSFTIIEVVIAVVILSLVGTALLKSAGINLDYFQKVSKKEQFSDFLTIVANHPNKDYNHLTKSLYDFLQNDFFIDDNELLSMLKNTKIKYIETDVKLKLPSLDSNETKNTNSFGIRLKKLSIISKDGGDYIFIAEIDG